MFEAILTKSFKKSLKKVQGRGKRMEKLDWVVTQLAKELPLPQKYKDHKLIGNYEDLRECHIEPDWLLIYKIDEDKLILVDTGSHSDLF